jgi:hypothetical protein
MPMPATSATTGSLFLELEAQFVPVKSIEGGALVGVVLTAAPAARAHFREKHLSGVRYEPIAIAASSRRARPLFDWITTAWQGTLAQKNGAVIRVDVNGRPQAKREFVRAILVETTVPMLDGASNTPADFTVRLAPERTRDVTPPPTLPPTSPSTPGKDAPFLSANFRLNIVGLDCTRVSKIDSFTVKHNLTPATGVPEFPNLRIELSAISAGTWRTWFQSFVIDGHSGATDEKSGSLSFLNANLTTVLATINFHNLGIFRLENAPADPSRVVAELYCERMELAIPPG